MLPPTSGRMHLKLSAYSWSFLSPTPAFFLVNIYAAITGSEPVQFYQQASAFLSTLDPHECLVLGGNFNTILEAQDHLGIEKCQDTMDILREVVNHHSLARPLPGHHHHLHLCLGGGYLIVLLPVGLFTFLDFASC